MSLKISERINDKNKITKKTEKIGIFIKLFYL